MGIIFAIANTFKYIYTIYSFVLLKKKYSEVTILDDDIQAKSLIFSYVIIFKFYDQPHYRSTNFRQDMIDNLSNVAIPGTGIPLSLFSRSYWVSLWYVMFVVPFVCWCGAINTVLKSSYSIGSFFPQVCDMYIEYLYHPDDWFSFWRLNCRLATYHSGVERDTGNAVGYSMEDKWTFLVQGKDLGVPVSPFLDIEDIVVKDKNMEGGLGINFYKNALHGGDYIIQKKIKNAAWLNKLLPSNAPLSTLRVITASNYPLQVYLKGKGNVNDDDWRTYIKPLSSVIRLGRKGASTDHSSVLFDVDLATGIIGEGRSNANWYNLSPTALFTGDLLPPPVTDSHPDITDGDAVITGKCIPDMKEAIDIVTWSHHKLMKDVPLVGWDVAFTSDGICLLEVNLSCNFFRGTFDKVTYFEFINNYWKMLEGKENGLTQFVPTSPSSTETTDKKAQ